METTKEKAPILEQVIGKLEKEQKKEIFVKKMGIGIYILLLFVWCWSLVELLPFSNVGEGDFNLWTQNSFQIALFLSAMVLFGSYLRNKIASKKREKMIAAIEELKKYLQEGVPPFVEIISGEDFGTIIIYHEEGIRMSKIMEIIPEKNDDLIIFRERFHKEISSLSEEQKKEYLIKIYELEDFFTYL